MRVLVLQHLACESPGVYADVLHERGAAIETVELDEGEALPERGEFDAIVAMGGPMSATDDDSLPWLAEEKRFIADEVRSGTPFWGVCLGVQLLAASLGARVYPGPTPEVGILPVELTEEALLDPVFAGLPRTLPTLQWHGDTFDLPDGAVRLAGSSAYANQAFRYGRSAYGVQFHVEVTADLAREWAAVPAYGEYLERVLGAGALDDLMARLAESSDEVLATGRRLFERWLDVRTAGPVRGLRVNEDAVVVDGTEEERDPVLPETPSVARRPSR
jgi:GMP synthase (glutamine-hydrolysing)